MPAPATGPASATGLESIDLALVIVLRLAIDPESIDPALAIGRAAAIGPE